MRANQGGDCRGLCRSWARAPEGRAVLGNVPVALFGFVSRLSVRGSERRLGSSSAVGAALVGAAEAGALGARRSRLAVPGERKVPVAPLARIGTALPSGDVITPRQRCASKTAWVHQTVPRAVAALWAPVPAGAVPAHHPMTRSRVRRSVRRATVSRADAQSRLTAPACPPVPAPEVPMSGQPAGSLTRPTPQLRLADRVGTAASARPTSRPRQPSPPVTGQAETSRGEGPRRGARRA
jgi:hypothetical protein